MTVASTAASKRNVLGVLVDAVDYDTATEAVLAAARDRRSFSLAAVAVHGIMTGLADPTHRAMLNDCDMVVPDGQPVRWALNLLHGIGLRDWVSGPELVGRVLDRMTGEGLSVYLYGSNPVTVDALVGAVRRRYPGIRVAGAEPGRYRPALPGEVADLARRISESGADAVLVGLGCPRQEIFVSAMRLRLDVPLLAVGAAFDYHAGRLRPAPVWMQRRGLAWLWRLILEPRRLWRRYLFHNPAYLVALAAQKLRLWRPKVRRAAERCAPSDRIPI